MLRNLNIKIGAQPIIWSNDDFHDLGGDIPLDTCLSEMREAGYAGSELGHKFGKDSRALLPKMKSFGLELVSGWHSSYLATNDFKKETADYRAHLNFLKEMGCQVVIIAECSYRTYHEPKNKLNWQREEAEKLSAADWKKVFEGLEEFAKIANSEGMKLAYHHHMGTVIQGLSDIDRLMHATTKLHLLGDTGHLAFAGENPIEVFKKYKDRLGHVHLKNIRPDVLKSIRNRKESFEVAVKEGVYTVPGDGGIDYKPIFQILKDINYSGWMVVEAEQDPRKANPFKYAANARKYIRETTGL